MAERPWGFKSLLPHQSVPSFAIISFCFCLSINEVRDTVRSNHLFHFFIICVPSLGVYSRLVQALWLFRGEAKWPRFDSDMEFSTPGSGELGREGYAYVQLRTVLLEGRGGRAPSTAPAKPYPKYDQRDERARCI